MSEEGGGDDNVIRSPEVPYVGTIPGGIFPGRSIVVSGMVQQPFSSDSKRFAIDLCCGLLISGDHMDNKALHFNPRFEKAGGWFSGPPDNQLVLNSYVSNQWGAEERHTNPFEEGKAFTLRIAAFENYFKIAVDGRHVCDFAHRIKPEYIKTIAVTGNIRVDYVQFRPALSVGPDGKLLVVKEPPKEERLMTVDRPAIPFAFDLLEQGFVSPQSLRLTLTPSLSGKRFCINLLAKGEILFHFRVDLPHEKEKEAVVRNSTSGSRWLTEERHIGQFPFSKGITHDIVIHGYEKSAAVDVDGLPYVKFNYRSGDDARDIDKITVEGDANLIRFVHKTFVKPQ